MSVLTDEQKKRIIARGGNPASVESTLSGAVLDSPLAGSYLYAFADKQKMVDYRRENQSTYQQFLGSIQNGIIEGGRSAIKLPANLATMFGAKDPYAEEDGQVWYRARGGEMYNISDKERAELNLNKDIKIDDATAAFFKWANAADFAAENIMWQSPSNPNEFWQGLGQGVGSVISFIALSPIRGANLFAKASAMQKLIGLGGGAVSGALVMSDQYIRDAKAAGLEDRDAVNFGLGLSTVIGMSERVGLDYIGKAATTPFMKSAMKKARGDAFEAGVKVMAKEGGEKGISKALQASGKMYSNALKTAGLAMIEGATGEFVQEFTQTYMEDAAKQLYDNVFAEMPMFKENTFDQETLFNALKAGMYGAIIGGGMSSLGSMQSQEFEETLFAAVDESKNRDALIKTYRERLNKLQKEGKLDEDGVRYGNQLIDKISNFTTDGISPDVTNKEARYQAYLLLELKDELTDKIAKINNPNLAPDYIPEQIAMVERSMKEIANTDKPLDMGMVEKLLNDIEQKYKNPPVEEAEVTDEEGGDKADAEWEVGQQAPTETEAETPKTDIDGLLDGEQPEVERGIEKVVSTLNKKLQKNGAGKIKYNKRGIDDITGTSTSTINTEEYNDLANEIKENGVVPILIDKNTGVVIDGNHRLEILKNMGVKNIPVFELDGEFFPNTEVGDNARMEFLSEYSDTTPLVSITEQTTEDEQDTTNQEEGATEAQTQAKQAEEELLVSLIDEIDMEVANLSKKRGEKAKKDLEKQLERKARAQKDLEDVRTELAGLRGERTDGVETGVGEEVGTGEEGVTQEGVEETQPITAEETASDVTQQEGKDMDVLYSNQFRNLPVIDDTDTDAMLTYEAEGMPTGLEEENIPPQIREVANGLVDKGYLYYNNGMFYLTPKGVEIVSAIESSTDTDVKSVLVSSLSTDEARFQNREGLDQQKVDSIAKNWNDAKQDPIHTWKDPKNGKTYVLSGHHRLAAAKKAGRTNVKTVDMSGMSEAEAVQFATVEANANRTMEKPSERAKVYRKMINDGKTKKEVKNLAEELEGKNAPYVLRLAALNPNGRVMELVRQAEASGDKATQKEAELIADWVGDARSKYDLTNQHETEMFEALLDKGFRQRVTKKTDFLQKVYSIAGAMDYDKGKPLNIRRFKNETEGQRAYDEIRSQIVAKISELQDKIADIKSRFTDTTRNDYISTGQADYDQVKSQADVKISELNAELKAEQKRLEQHQRDKGKFTRAESTGSLFDSNEASIEENELTEAEAKSVANKIRGLKINTKGKAFDATLGLPVAIYNGAVELIATSVEGGMMLKNAIAKAMKYIDGQMGGKSWNKGLFAKDMNVRFAVTLPNGERAIVERDTSKKTAKVIDGWYLPIEQKVLNNKRDKMPANNWAGLLRSKEDEDLWTGVRQWLEEKGTESVSKKEIQDFINNNRIELVNVVKDDNTTLSKSEMESRGFTFEMSDGYHVIFPPKGVDSDFKSVSNKNLDDAIRTAQEAFSDDIEVESADTKFSQYVLEGEKENYKEVLVTLPVKKQKEYSNAQVLQAYQNFNPNATLDEALEVAKNRPKEIISELEKGYLQAKDTEIDNNFKSEHWDEPNIVVHLRMDTRTDADGKKVLFVEEIQSDWGQKGKKKGFKGVVEKRYEDAYDIAKAIYNIKRYYSDDKEIKQQALSNLKELAQNKGISESEIIAISNEHGDFTRPMITSSVVSAPFVTDTNSWVKLGLKVAMQEAVKQGVDRIAWSTGTQQFERWGSERIDWVKTNERWNISIQEQVEGTAFEGVNVNEKALSERGVTITSKEKLREVIKRNLSRERNDAELDKLTDRIWNRMQNEDSGTSLPRKEGMEGFYGVPSENSLGIVGGVASKLFGQEVGTVEIEIQEQDVRLTGEEFDISKAPKELSDLIDKYEEGISDGNYSELKKFSDEARLLGYEVDYDLDGTINKFRRVSEKPMASTQHSIEVTPELKRQVEKGLPMFGNIDVKIGENTLGSAIAGANMLDQAFKAGVDLSQSVEDNIQEMEDKGIIEKDCN